MEEFSTPPIPGSSLAEDHRQPRALAAPHLLGKRPRTQSGEQETNEEDDEPVENAEPEHHVDISV